MDFVERLGCHDEFVTRWLRLKIFRHQSFSWVPRTKQDPPGLWLSCLAMLKEPPLPSSPGTRTPTPFNSTTVSLPMTSGRSELMVRTVTDVTFKKENEAQTILLIYIYSTLYFTHSCFLFMSAPQSEFGIRAHRCLFSIWVKYGTRVSGSGLWFLIPIEGQRDQDWERERNKRVF
jgi:hypothetical protein